MKRLVFLLAGTILSGCGARTDPGGAPPASGDTIVQIASNGDRACALRGSGEILCWGFPEYGGTYVAEVLARVPGALEIAVSDPWSVGRRAVLARLTDGRVLELAAGSVTEVNGLRDAVRISTGGSHACALRRSGDVVCWGDDSVAQIGAFLGGGPVTIPVKVGGLPPVVEIAAGEFSTCARDAQGRVFCWGRAFAGQLGDGLPLSAHHDCGESESLACSAAPVRVEGLEDATAIAAGLNYACAARASGAIVCWGWNTAGQLGDGTEVDRPLPHPTQFEEGSQLFAGYQQTCSLHAGGVACAGTDPPRAVARTPRAIAELGPVRQVAIGWSSTCVLSVDGDVSCWFRGDRGTTPITPVPGL
jgi:alpha-tubulin suppressor-like RCC1 family protein